MVYITIELRYYCAIYRRNHSVQEEKNEAGNKIICAHSGQFILIAKIHSNSISIH